jgi:hypothetical protein
MNSASIGLKPIGNLLGDSSAGPPDFWIPKYQRGYRWRKIDVTRLLNDLTEFLDEDTGRPMRPFYCLQPLVVKKITDTTWEIVDGQQRLTTLYLMFKYLTKTPPFGLSYETRDRSKEYLESLDEVRKGVNIDFHHIYNAHAAVTEWFGDNPNEEDRFRKLLANAEPDGRNVRFIWYELPAVDYAEDVFTRLNNDKIQLTDEELIRALFLRNPEGGKLAEGAFQHRLALEWDRIETTLQDPAFWAFLSTEPGQDSGRIRLLFELCSPKKSPKNACAPENGTKDERELFLHYEKELAKAAPAKLREVWQRIVNCFETLEEWWRDPELFQLIGFLTTILTDDSVSELRTLLGEFAEIATTKSAFKAHLRIKIRERLIGEKGKTVAGYLAELDYSNTRPIRPTLALFNIATLLRTNEANLRFPFHRYHDHSWDIEHVRSQAGDNLNSHKVQNEWLELCELQLKSEKSMEASDKKTLEDDLLRQIAQFRSGVADAPTFEDLYKGVLEHFGEIDLSNLHSIGNLTILDASTNRAYKNAPFAVKRSTILAKERNGTFILPCTRDLFLKCYSEKPGNLRRWTPEDGKDHEAAICYTLEQFFTKEGDTKR